jgi:hypothetical protein
MGTEIRKEGTVLVLCIKEGGTLSRKCHVLLTSDLEAMLLDCSYDGLGMTICNSAWFDDGQC